MGYPVAFSEIAGKNGKKLQEFYTSVFGWTIDSQKVPGYGYVDTGSDGDLKDGIREE